MGLLKGVDIDNTEEEQKKRFEEIKRRAEAKLSGDDSEPEKRDLLDIGIDIEIEED